MIKKPIPKETLQISKETLRRSRIAAYVLIALSVLGCIGTSFGNWIKGDIRTVFDQVVLFAVLPFLTVCIVAVCAFLIRDASRRLKSR